MAPVRGTCRIIISKLNALQTVLVCCASFYLIASLKSFGLVVFLLLRYIWWLISILRTEQTGLSLASSATSHCHKNLLETSFCWHMLSWQFSSIKVELKYLKEDKSYLPIVQIQYKPIKNFTAKKEFYEKKDMTLHLRTTIQSRVQGLVRSEILTNENLKHW